MTKTPYNYLTTQQRRRLIAQCVDAKKSGYTWAAIERRFKITAQSITKGMEEFNIKLK